MELSLAREGRERRRGERKRKGRVWKVGGGDDGVGDEKHVDIIATHL